MRKTQQRQRKKPQKKGGTTYNISLSDPHHTLPTLSVTAMKIKSCSCFPAFLPPPPLCKAAEQDRAKVTSPRFDTKQQQQRRHEKNTEVLSFFCFIVDGRVGNGSEGWLLSFCLGKERITAPWNAILNSDRLCIVFFSFFAFLFLRN